ncbi:MAG: aminotransferase class I/II-fold pyridoxal phosphate-dependent enzyme [Desulfovibrio sp.]|nr:aminotransferase class I/II-fold pyridoxal phosphate-dependent enzyme [Desulfovibrio sp.]
MGESKKSFGMSAADKARLLSQLKGASAPSPLASRSLRHTVAPELLRFDTLPVYTQLNVQKAVAQKLGISEPYYICHDSLSQATATIAGKTYLNFSCYDYLGLNGDQRLVQAATQAAERYGLSASASRLTAGERPPHHALEKALADLYGTEDCLVFVSGHATNMSTIASLFGPQDAIFYDSASHNSLVLGAVLAGSARFAYANNDLAALRSQLEQHRASFKRALIVTEGLFGMDGEIADVPGLVALKREFGCFLMVDEAHSLGTVGQRGYGVGEYFGLKANDVDIWMGTLSKTLCGCGGYIAGSHVLIEILKYQAPGFVYSVGMPPLLAQVSLCALTCMRDEPWRVTKLQENGQKLLRQAKALGLDCGKAQGYAVIPIMLGDSLTAVILSQLLKEEGVLALPIIYPGVEEGRARLRFFVSAAHSEAQIAEAVEKTSRLLPKAKSHSRDFAG